MKRTFILGLLFALACGAFGKQENSALDTYNVVWDTPSKNASGSMPLGNGDTALNVWVEENGDLLFYIAKSDSWDGNQTLLKLGRVRVKLKPNPFLEGQHFKQELKLRESEIMITGGKSGEEISLRVWVDANAPVIHVEANGDQAFELETTLESWRNETTELPAELANGVRALSGGPPVFIESDTILPARDNTIRWYHRNKKSVYEMVMKGQHLDSLIAKYPDPLLNRTFGGMIMGEGLASKDKQTLKSSKARKNFLLSVHALTAQTQSADEWVEKLERQVSANTKDIEAARTAHRDWWNRFWNRSWIDITDSKASTGNEKGVFGKYSLLVGEDHNGGNRLSGVIDQLNIYTDSLTESEVADLYAVDRNSTDDSTYNQIKAVSLKRPEAGQEIPKENLGTTYSKDTLIPPQLTMELRLKPARGVVGRLLDCVSVGGRDGFLLDTYPSGENIRFILGEKDISREMKVDSNGYCHLVIVNDAKNGSLKFYMNGVLDMEHIEEPEQGDSFTVARGYALQRYITACAGRGNYPIKFNGSLFTVDIAGEPDTADYRRWGGCYWFQNTRLSYWPMLAAGDLDMMDPLFKMYLDALAFAEDKTRLYYDHEGAFFPETMNFWGTYAMTDFGWGNKDVEPTNSWIRYYYQSFIELTMMMLDRYDLTLDPSFAKTYLLPLADSCMKFYDQHWKRGDDGKIFFSPASSLETWHTATDPAPDIVGLGVVLKRLIALPKDLTTETQRRAWAKTLADLPEIPTKKEGEKEFLLPAKTFSDSNNTENPELYAVFPYRLYGVNKPDLAVAQETFQRRRFKNNYCWYQDPIQAACLGLTDQVQANVIDRFKAKDPGSRFPAFWGAGHDWIPDQDAGGVAQMALQSMLMQCDGKQIVLLPAWPKEWNVSFKLHAPYNTTIDCVYQDGKIQKLDVEPRERAKDVVVMMDAASK